MIDIHCHILPGVDDGPSTKEAAMALAHAAFQNGVTGLIVTPHIYPTRWHNTKSKLVCDLEILKLHLEHQQIGLEVRLGGEVRIGDDILPLLDQGEIPFLGQVDGFNIMLLEFPDQQIPVGSRQLARYFLQNGIRPIIAHPERNHIFQQDIYKLNEFLDLGCWLQVTAGSLTGQFGRNARKAALSLLENDWVYAIASDCHNLDYRPPNLHLAHAAIMELYDADYADLLTKENPGRIFGVAHAVA